MSLGLRCPTCQKKMSVPEHAIGRRVQCPHCEWVFRYVGQKDITLGRVRLRVAAPDLSAADVGAAASVIASELSVADATVLPKTSVLSRRDSEAKSESDGGANSEDQ